MNASVLWSAAAASLAGALLGPHLRARVFHHTVPPDRPWRTACPHCGRTLVRLGWRGLLAILPSNGRCPHCPRRIGPLPLTVEALTAVVFGLLALRVDRPLPLAALCWTAMIGVALAHIDVAVHRLPDQLTLAAFAGVVVLLAIGATIEQRPAAVGWAALNGLGMAGCYLLLVLIHPAGMGLGDAKLALGLGVALGWFGWLSTVLGTAAGFLLAGLFSIVLLVLGKVTRKTAIPHGPFMLLGALATIVLTGYRYS